MARGCPSHARCSFPAHTRIVVGGRVDVADSIPLEWNLAELQGVVFDKGCYMGQELVARTHFKVRDGLVCGGGAAGGAGLTPELIPHPTQNHTVFSTSSTQKPYG